MFVFIFSIEVFVIHFSININAMEMNIQKIKMIIQRMATCSTISYYIEIYLEFAIKT